MQGVRFRKTKGQGSQRLPSFQVFPILRKLTRHFPQCPESPTVRDDLEQGSKRFSCKTKTGPATQTGQKLFENLQRNLEEPSPVHKYKKRSIIGGYHNRWRRCPVKIWCPYTLPKKRKSSLSRYNKPNQMDMERKTSCLTRRQTYLFVLFVLFVRVSVMEHLGTSVGDGGPPTTEAFPASAFLTARSSSVGWSVRVTERLFLVALIELSFLASYSPSGSER